MSEENSHNQRDVPPSAGAESSTASICSMPEDCSRLMRDWPSDIMWCETEPNSTKSYNAQRQSASMALRSLKKARKKIKNTDHALRRVSKELNKQLFKLKEEEFLIGDESPLRSSLHPPMTFTSTRVMGSSKNSRSS
uniref:Uncharacterized protein n=1 Tax=Hanusia phi TaxID=3032 RepID=A0A7S0HYW5_9CRYP